MLDGIIDNLTIADSEEFKKLIISLYYDSNNSINNEENALEFIKQYKIDIEQGRVLRYSMHKQISNLKSYMRFDDFINFQRQKEVDRLNKEYYSKKPLKR